MGMFLLGVLFGVLIMFIIFVVRYDFVGILRVDRSDPDDIPYLFVELDDRNILLGRNHKKYVILKVNDEDYISRE